MAGVKGRSGGARPNPGPKRKAVQDWQARNLLVLQAEFSEADIRVIAQSLCNALKAGDKDAWNKGLAYVFGAAPKEVTVKGDPESPLLVKGYVKVSPDDWPARKTE